MTTRSAHERKHRLAFSTIPLYYQLRGNLTRIAVFSSESVFPTTGEPTMSPLAPVDAPTTLLVALLSSSGAEDAWRVFLARYWPRLVEWAKRGDVGRDDAEQIASQVLLKLSCGRALVSFDRGQGRFRPWLRKVVHRVAIDFLRKRSNVPGSVGRGGGEK
jgi:hypothetical protein